VLLNLARNSVEAGAHRLRINAVRQDDTIAIDVADDGPGLAPRARENLFRPFAASGRPGGSGLGLAIARELMRLHGGDLVLVASTGGGTIFRITMPAPKPAAKTASREKEPAT
jgi:signal transduction histidine kinase